MKAVWYQAGLRFECTMCGRCCTGEPGFVWVSDEEVTALAEFVGEEREVFEAVYTRLHRGHRTLREKANNDCVFYDPAKGCTVYEVRPVQCRTWPFWETNLKTPARWQEVAENCPGCNVGDIIPVEEITQRLNQFRL
ncbi:MAG: YkgJ family cysteine cluster protein [Zavarzinella sp.]